jgi:hypothetical protein
LLSVASLYSLEKIYAQARLDARADALIVNPPETS